MSQLKTFLQTKLLRQPKAESRSTSRAREQYLITETPQSISRVQIVMQAINPGYEIIDLGSDSEDPVYPTDDFFPLSGEQADLENDDYGLENSQYREIPGPTRSQTVHINAPTQYESSLSEVLEVFPDISHDHVRQLYETWIQANGSGDRAQEQNVAAELTIQIVDAGEYPKEKDRINDLKRKRSQALNSDEEEEVRWKDATRELDTCTYNGEA